MKSKLPEKVYIKIPLMVATKKLPDWFDGLGERQAEDYVAKMYKHPDFGDGVDKPSQRSTFVDPYRFREFLKYLDDAKFE